MTEDEQEILASIPNSQRSRSRKSGQPSEAPGAEAEAFVKEVLASTSQPVVMFGFEWCEFCWSVRRLFQEAGIPFRSIDVDTAEFRRGGRGGKILRAVFAKVGVRTVPQVFVGGRRVGDATEVLSAFDDGSLHANLASLDPPIIPVNVENALSFLPTWSRRPSGHEVDRNK